MAEAKSPSGGADFVAKIVKDPKNPPATLMLTGFVGASSEDGHTRLYFDPHLSSYAEVPNDGILHTQAAATDDGLGAVHMWIARDAQLIYGPVSNERPKGAFLDGPIVQDHMAGAAAAAAGVGVGGAAHMPVTLFVGCGVTHQAFCISHGIICNQPLKTFVPVCLPHTINDPGCMVSAHFGCPSLGICPSIACQSIVCNSLACHPGGGAGGPVMHGQMAAAAPAAAAVGGAVHMPVTLSVGCGPTHQVFCVSQGIICNQPFRTHVPFCLPHTVADPGCMVSAHFGCPSLGICPSIACNTLACHPGGPVELPQQHAAMAAAPQAQVQQAPAQQGLAQHGFATLTPACHISQGIICNFPFPTHTPACWLPQTVAGPGCMVSAHFGCPTLGACPSIACNSLACHPGNPIEQRANFHLPPTVLVGGLCHTFHCGGGGGHLPM